MDKKLIVTYLKNESPELALIVEFNSAWAKEIKKLESLYPHMKAVILESNFGLAVISKKKLTVDKTFVDRENIIPALFVSVESGDTPLKIVLLHSFPPIGGYGTLIRDRYLKTISRHIADIDGPVLVCGDFNTVPWAAVFQDFLRESHLEVSNTDSLIRTWPTYPITSLSIDHCLHKNMNVSGYKRGPNIGSDHWPLLLEVSPKERSIAGG